MTADDDEPFVTPTPERMRKARGDIDDFKTETGRSTPRISAIDLLKSRGTINGEQYVAGNRYYRDWSVSQGSAMRSSDPAREYVDGQHGASSDVDYRLDAAKRFLTATVAIGTEHAKVLVAMLLKGETLAEFGCREFRLRNEKQGSLKASAVFQYALQALDNHYYGQGNSKRYSQGYTASHEPDYKPVIQRKEG